MITQEIDLNLIPSSEPIIVHLNQYDEGKGRLICHLYSGSTPYTPVNATVKVQGTKPDDKAFQYYCDISGNTVTVDINIQMTAVAGRVPTQLIVTEYTGVSGSFAFELDVQVSTLPPLIDVSETDIPILTEEAQEAARRAVQSAQAAAESASEAEAWTAHPPYIGENKHWFVYDVINATFIDSNIVAEGKDGEDGSMWYRGTDVEGKDVTPTSFDTGLTVKAGDLYLNVSEGAIYHCVTGGTDDVATWSYDFTMSGGGGGGTDNYNDLINQPKIGGVTLVGNKTVGELGGVQTFKGRSGAVIPTQGDYTDYQIILASAMHIGGETQTNVKEALEALEENGGGLLPYLYITSEAGATVTVVAPDGSTIIPTQASAGHWECEVPSYGIYVIHSVLAGQGDAILSLTVDDVKEYHVTDSHYDFTINVTADIGSSIRVSAGSEIYMGTGTGSPVAFVVHQASTQYTITETLDGFTDTEIVTSASVSGGSVNVTLHVFSATLDISTNSPELASAPISVYKDESGTPILVGTTSFVSSSASFVVHEEGDYTLTCTYQGNDYSESVTVSAETTYPVQIDTIPDGSTVTPTDDIQTWLKCAGIRDKAYTTLSAVLADHDTLYLLMASDNAVDYLVRSTTWVSGITADEYGMKYIGKWNYASDTLLDDSTWHEAIVASSYMKMVLNVEVPQMTSATTPSGVVSASTAASGYDAYKSFKSDSPTQSNYWSANASTGWLQYTFPSAMNLRKIWLQNPSWAMADTNKATIVKTFEIWASNDDFATHDVLTDVLTNTAGTTIGGEASYDINNSSSYMAYRLVALTNNGSGSYNAVGRLQFYGRQDVTENVIDIYSAAGDTVTITPQSGSPITCVTDSTGHGTVSRNDMPAGTYTLSSIIAKDPSNLSNDYTKTVTITEGTSEIYVMPDNCLYWYGYRDANLETINSTNGWSGFTNWLKVPEYTTNYVVLETGTGSTSSGLGSSSVCTVESSIFAIIEGVTQTGTQYGTVGVFNSKAAGTFASYLVVDTNTLKSYAVQASGNYYIATQCAGGAMTSGNVRKTKVYALWYD